MGLAVQIHFPHTRESNPKSILSFLRCWAAKMRVTPPESTEWADLWTYQGGNQGPPSQDFHVFYIRYSLDPRNPQAFPLHTMLRRGTRTQFLPFYVITCSGLSGKEGFSTSVPHSQTLLQISHQGSQHLHQQQLKELPVLAAQRAQNPGITALILILFLRI